ncbi:UNVERIFIED_CONTAM: hypothetical protein GTU68_043116 [Idotea baltica]|nr:hypothetical protein [Idotea baltica]
MPKFSANLGFLWTELDLCNAVKAAKKAGFDAVECHFPFSTPTEDLIKTLEETGLEMLSLNTAPGDISAGEFGLNALPNRVDEAQTAIKQAIDYASVIGTTKVHVMSGTAPATNEAMAVFMSNLKYAAELAQPLGIDILIEPINRRDVPDYFLADLTTAVKIIDQLGYENIKIMFDCYHIQIIHGEIKPLLKKHIDLIGHIQFASVPQRHEPDEGDIDYAELFKWLDELAYDGYIGAEYKPRGTTDEGLGWMDRFR